MQNIVVLSHNTFLSCPFVLGRTKGESYIKGYERAQRLETSALYHSWGTTEQGACDTR